MRMTGRKCGNCKHFEPAPLWRKGWCRNPLLFSPQQSHLVNDEDLDCERGMGNYWEAADSDAATAMPDMSPGFREPVADVFRSSHDRPQPPLVSASGQPVYPVTGAAGRSDDEPPYDEPPGGGWSGEGPPNTGGRDYNYYPEERYWTDYLRIAAPILGVILMVLLFWWWISNFLDDNDDNGSTASNGATPTTLPIVQETPAPQEEATQPSGTPPIVVEGQTPPAGEATQPPNGEAPTEPSGEVPPETGIYNGATVEVVNTGGTGVNVRTQPSTDAEIVSVFLDGTVLTVIGVSIEAEGFVWWPVSGDGIEGYVVQEYLALIE